MKKRTLAAVLTTAVITVGIGVGAQVLANEDTSNNLNSQSSFAPEFTEVEPFMKRALPDMTDEQLEEWFNSHQSETGFRGPGMMRGGFGFGSDTEFSEVQPFMKEMFPDMTDEQLKEWFNSRQSETGFRGPGMMRGGFGFGSGSDTEFSEVQPFMKEMFPDMTDEQLKEWFNSRQSDTGFRGPGMMRGGFSPGSDSDSDGNSGRGFGPRS